MTMSRKWNPYSIVTCLGPLSKLQQLLNPPKGQPITTAVPEEGMPGYGATKTPGHFAGLLGQLQGKNPDEINLAHVIEPNRGNQPDMIGDMAARYTGQPTPMPNPNQGNEMAQLQQIAQMQALAQRLNMSSPRYEF